MVFNLVLLWLVTLAYFLNFDIFMINLSLNVYTMWTLFNVVMFISQILQAVILLMIDKNNVNVERGVSFMVNAAD